ncbi:MAG: hypothetical protein M5U01_03840 [Ardenticatenaceae bacterium]|nr:hypothetical protein [Ardenticatenaceae bacterium]
MNDNKVSSFWTLAFTALSIAVVAVLAVQVFHEASHAVAAVLVGARLEAFNLFGVAHTWTGRANWWGELSIAGNAALMNVLAGLVAVVLFSQSWVRRRPTRRLFLLYVAGYSLLTGFGYLLFDGIFFQPGGQNVGDWKKVLELVGGNWIVRFVVILIGLGGSLWVFFWLPRSALCFGEEMTDQRQRVRLMLRLLMLPYVAINTLFTVLSFWHPLGGDGVIITVMQYWFGYVAFFWAFLIASYWTQATTPPPDTTPLAADFNWRWGVGAAVAVGLAILVLLPTIYFSIYYPQVGFVPYQDAK